VFDEKLVIVGLREKLIGLEKMGS